MRNLIWLGPDREVYTVTVLEEPWDEGRETLTIVFRCERTGWLGATELNASEDALAVGIDDLPLLLKKARASG
jgi:hypothetical protein